MTVNFISNGGNTMTTNSSITRRRILALGLGLAVMGSALALTGGSQAQAPAQRFITVSSTTSTTDSGLFEHLLPAFKAKTGIEVRVVSQGTGQALDTGRRGDADVVFVHAKAQEQTFVTEGFGVERKPVMYNDFVLIGPKADPAGIKGGKDIVAGLKAVQAKGAPFVSRGDKSGTHAAELNLWKVAGIDIAQMKGSWYREIGQGMGAALNTAAAWAPMCSPTAPPGSTSRTGAISRSWWKATPACSTSMA